MSSIRGLYTKYIVSKRIPCPCGADQHCRKCAGRGFTTEDVSSEAQYFILRIDKEGWHGEASRVAVAAYADLVEQFNSKLADEMRVWLRCHAQEDYLGITRAGTAARVEYRSYIKGKVANMLNGAK